MNDAGTSPDSGAAVKKTNRLAQIRNVAVFGVAALWVIGYVVWVLFAYRNGLGWIDPWEIKGQAIISGIVPTLLLAAFYPLTRVIRAFYRWTQRDVANWERTLAGALTLLGIVCFVASWIIRALPGESIWVGRVLYAWLACWLFASLFSGRGTDRLNKILAVGYIGFVAFSLLASFLVVYVWFGFRELPQELGGPGSRCVTLDLDVSGWSEATVRELAEVDDSPPSSTFRSRPVELVLETDRYVYVHWKPNEAKKSRYLRINASHIRGVFDCATD